MTKQLIFISLCLISFNIIAMDLQRATIQYIYDLSDNPARGDTQLHTSIRQGTEEGRTAASQLLQNGFDVDHTSCMLGHTALHVATSSLDPLATQLLLERGALAQNTVNGLSALHLAVWAAIGTPIVADESVQTMLLAMRSTQVVKLNKEERAVQARQVITLLLTHVPKSLISKLDDVVAKRIENARALCNQEFYKTNQSASAMAAQSGDQELADLCNPDRLHQHYQKIRPASLYHITIDTIKCCGSLRFITYHLPNWYYRLRSVLFCCHKRK